jgi:hypothetical protein
MATNQLGYLLLELIVFICLFEGLWVWVVVTSKKEKILTKDVNRGHLTDKERYDLLEEQIRIVQSFSNLPDKIVMDMVRDAEMMYIDAKGQ